MSRNDYQKRNEMTTTIVGKKQKEIFYD